MEHRVLKKINKDVNELQCSHLAGRLRLASKDRKTNSEMKTQVDVALKPMSSGRQVRPLIILNCVFNSMIYIFLVSDFKEIRLGRSKADPGKNLADAHK